MKFPSMWISFALDHKYIESVYKQIYMMMKNLHQDFWQIKKMPIQVRNHFFELFAEDVQKENEILDKAKQKQKTH